MEHDELKEELRRKNDETKLCTETYFFAEEI